MWTIADQVAPRLPVLVCPKREFIEKHHAKIGLHSDEPISCDVMGFDDKMKCCSSLDKLRYGHTKTSILDCAFTKCENGYGH